MAVVATVLKSLNKKELAKGDDGKLQLTADDEKVLKDKYGDKFLTSFKEELATMAVPSASDDREIEDRLLQLENVNTELSKALSDKKSLQELVDTLMSTAEDDKGEVVNTGKKAGRKMAFIPDMALMHNKNIESHFFGNASMEYSNGSTIDATQLQAEFGKYVTHERLEIIKKLTGELTCTQYMTTIVTDLTEYRASIASIQSVLQQFTSKWTPTKAAKFTPLTIKNFKLKVNVEVVPADIMDQYIGYMYDENLTPANMPIVKYIVDELVIPQLLEDLENALAIGKFKDFSPETDNTAAPETAAIEAMTGFVTTLRELKAANKVIGAWLLDGVVLTAENILAKIEAAVDDVAPKYKKKKMFIHADPDLILIYNRAYQAKYPNTKNQDKDNLQVDFTKFTWGALDGMQGTGAFFITPKENFRHLMSRDPQKAQVYMQTENYKAKVFMEFWKGTGFAMQEAIFAYLPPVESTGSVGGGL